MNIFDIDMTVMKDEEKLEFFYEFAQHCKKSMDGYPVDVQIFGQLLVITRMYNFLNHCLDIVSKNIPQIIQDEKQMIWNYFKDNVSKDSFKEFGEKSEVISMWINTGEEMSPEAEELWETYSEEWKGSFNYNNGCVELFTYLSCIHWQINESQAVDWNIIGEALNFIAEYIGDYFEDVYDNGTGGYKHDELELRETQICASSSFKMVIEQIVGDLKTATSTKMNKEEIRKIEEIYSDEILFNEEKCKIYAEELAEML